MKFAQTAPSIWPGYVAAIASLVLSLLLLLAILSFALTQVGNIVTQYTQEILRNTLAAKPNKPFEPNKPSVNVTPARVRTTPGTAEPIAMGVPLRQIKLIFGVNLSDIPASQLAEVISSIQQIQIQAPDDVAWRIWATTLASDSVMERSAYRLLLSARKKLIDQGIQEKRIELRIDKSSTPPPGYQQGEIIIHIAPVQFSATDGVRP
jgi:hypothetical protein